MFIDISDIFKEIGSSKKIKGELSLDDFTYQGERVLFDKPFSVEGNISNAGELLMLEANIKGEVTLQCGACAEFYSHLVNFDTIVKLKPSFEENEDDLDIYIYFDDKIDMADVVMEEFLLQLPIRRRCRIDCKGFCIDCGVNLNQKQCDCHREEQGQHQKIDSRLAVLKDFFADKDKEV